MVLKGVNSNYDWSFFKNNLIEGDVPQINNSSPTNDVIISEKIALKLKLKTGDPLYCIFLMKEKKFQETENSILKVYIEQASMNSIESLLFLT
jgi:lipoprotein-releasing system permease protein